MIYTHINFISYIFIYLVTFSVIIYSKILKGFIVMLSNYKTIMSKKYIDTKQANKRNNQNSKDKTIT